MQILKSTPEGGGGDRREARPCEEREGALFICSGQCQGRNQTCISKNATSKTKPACVVSTGHPYQSELLFFYWYFVHKVKLS